MNFQVKDWMIDLVVLVEPNATVAEALAIMRRRYLNSIIVNKSAQNSDYGIVTSTDICDKIVAQEQNPSEINIKDVMTSPLITVNKNMDLKDCSRLMSEHKIHHLPVVDDDGKLVGMISATDFLVVAEAMGRAPGDRII